MASTKSTTSIWSSQSLTAAAADTVATAINLTTKYDVSINVKLTNGATGPTVAAKVLVQVSNDNSKWYDLGYVLYGSTTNSAVVSHGGVEIPFAAQYVRLVAGSNTGQAVTVDADISVVTAIS